MRQKRRLVRKAGRKNECPLRGTLLFPLTISVKPARFRTQPTVQLVPTPKYYGGKTKDFLISTVHFERCHALGMVLAIVLSGITLADPIPKASVEIG